MNKNFNSKIILKRYHLFNPSFLIFETKLDSSVFSGLVEGVHSIINVMLIQTGDGDSSIQSLIHMVLIHHFLGMAFSDTSEGKHTYLVSNMIPIMLTPCFIKFIYKLFPHLPDSSAHGQQVLVPNFSDLWSPQNKIGDH